MQVVQNYLLKLQKAAHDPAFSNPMHLVHPEHGAEMVFDIYGMAVRPTCAAIWDRDHEGRVLLNERKPPKRAMPKQIKGRKQAKRAASLSGARRVNKRAQ